MVRSLECLVDKYGGPDRYYRYEGKYRRIKVWSREGAFSLKDWRNLVYTGIPQIRNPNRIVNDLHQRTHDDPSPLGDLNRVYPHAVEMGRIGLSPAITVGFTLFFLALAAFFGFVLQKY